MLKNYPLLQTLIYMMLVLGGLWLYEKSLPIRAPQALELRAAIDIGSGSSNLKIAKVDPKTHKIVTEVFKQSITVPYQKHMELSHDNTFDKEVQDIGLQAMKTFKEITDKYQVKKVVAVATAAFRQATNAPELAREIERQTGIHVWIIDQDLEGILAFEAAMATTDAKPDKSIVWDIGGGSVQLTGQNSKDEFVVQKGTLASIPFKNALIGEIQGKNSKEVTTPNPVSEQDVNKALEYVKEHMTPMDPFIAQRLKEPGVEVIAVGNLFNFGIKPTAGDNAIATQQGLETGVKNLLNKTNEDLNKGPFTEIAVSDPLLILSYMKAMDIQQVHILNVNNADGALSYPPFWKAEI